MNKINKKYFVYSFKDGKDICLDEFLISKYDLSIVLVNSNEFMLKNKDINKFLLIEEVFCYQNDLYFIHENLSKILVINYELVYENNFMLIEYGFYGAKLFIFNKLFFVFFKNLFFGLINSSKKFIIFLFLAILLFFNNNVVNENMEYVEKKYIQQKKIYQGFEYFSKNNNLKEYKFFNQQNVPNNNFKKKINKINSNKENKKLIDDDELYFLRMKVKK